MKFPTIQEKDFDQILTNNLNDSKKHFRLERNKNKKNWPQIKEEAIAIFNDLKKNPGSISGFVHGEGTFSSSPNDQYNTYQFSAQFNVFQNEKEISLLLAFSLFFYPYGKIRSTTGIKTQVKEANLSFGSVNTQIVPYFLAFFEKYPLQSKRRMIELVCLKIIAETTYKKKVKNLDDLFLMSLCLQKLKKKKSTDKVLSIIKGIKDKVSEDKQKKLANFLEDKISFDFFPFSNNNLPVDIDQKINKLIIDKTNIFNPSNFWNQQDTENMNLLKKETKGHLDYLYKNPDYITLFFDGEGSLYCSAELIGKQGNSLSFKPGITISQNERDLPLILAINLYFDCGTTSISLISSGGKLTPLARIDFVNIVNLNETLIPFFEKHSFKTYRKERLEALKELVSIRLKKIHTPLKDEEQYRSVLAFLKLRVRVLSPKQEKAVRFIFDQVGKKY